MGEMENGKRPGSRGSGFVAKDTNGNQQVHMRGMSQGISEGSEPSAAQERTQSALEAEAEESTTSKGSEEEGLRVPRVQLRTP